MYRSILVRHRSTERRSRRHASLASALLVALVGSSVLAFSAPAQSHTDLAQANPAPASEVAGSVAAIRLVFNQDIDIDLATVIVTDPTGRNLAVGAPQTVADAVVQPISPSVNKGSHEVGYRVVSTDGHPISGSYRFRVTAAARSIGGQTADGTESQAGAPGPSAAPVRTGAQPRRNDQAGSQVGEPTAAARSGIAPVLGAGVLALIVGAGAVLAWRRRGTGSAPSPS